MERKKILITIDWFLPGTKSGGPVRSYANMIEHLGKYHDFYIITRDTDYCSDEVYSNIDSNTWNQLNSYTFVYYFSKEHLNKRNFKKLLIDTPCDIVYINGIYSWYFSILPLWILRKQKNVIVATRGMLNPQAFSIKKNKKKTFLAFAKFLSLYKNVKFHATNEEEANHIKSVLGKQCKVSIAPNLPRLSKPDPFINKEKSKPTTFVNIARISTEKGTLNMINALHQVKGEMILDLFGPVYNEAYWELCQKSIVLLPEYIKVTYKGVLPSEEVVSTLQQYDFFIMLSEGENFGHAILEALMAGCPVIISNQTPWKDLQSKGIGWDININDTKQIIETLDNAITMGTDDYKERSKNAILFSKKFSENPELLMLNLNLFN
jgi:glycosyltransferase involved in cell wall biosynthesis